MAAMRLQSLSNPALRQTTRRRACPAHLAVLMQVILSTTTMAWLENHKR